MKRATAEEHGLQTTCHIRVGGKIWKWDLIGWTLKLASHCCTQYCKGRTKSYNLRAQYTMQFNHCAQSYANMGLRSASRLPWDRKRAVRPHETSDKQINDILAYLISSLPFFPLLCPQVELGVGQANDFFIFFFFYFWVGKYKKTLNDWDPEFFPLNLNVSLGSGSGKKSELSNGDQVLLFTLFLC